MKFFKVTLTNAGTAYSLLTLLKALSGFKDGARQILIQSAAANTGYVRLGGSDVAALTYGINLPTANSSVSLNSYSIGDMYALAEVAGSVINVTLVF